MFRFTLICSLFTVSGVAFFAAGIRELVERWDTCLNKFGGYVEK